MSGVFDSLGRVLGGIGIEIGGLRCSIDIRGIDGVDSWMIRLRTVILVVRNT